MEGLRLDSDIKSWKLITPTRREGEDSFDNNEELDEYSEDFDSLKGELALFENVIGHELSNKIIYFIIDNFKFK